MANANYPLDPNFEDANLKSNVGAYYLIIESLSYGDDPAQLAQELYDEITNVYENAGF